MNSWGLNSPIHDNSKTSSKAIKAEELAVFESADGRGSVSSWQIPASGRTKLRSKPDIEPTDETPGTDHSVDRETERTTTTTAAAAVGAAGSMQSAIRPSRLVVISLCAT